MRKMKLVLFSLLLCFLFTLTGCGKNKALDTYKENLLSFTDAVSEKSDEIDAIDPFSETASADLLASLDEMDKLFSDFASLQVPSQFGSISDLAESASSYMSQAVSLYHTAFEADGYDSYSADAAKQNYDRAMKRIEYIADVLRGEIPDDENIHIVTETDDSDLE